MLALGGYASAKLLARDRVTTSPSSKPLGETIEEKGSSLSKKPSSGAGGPQISPKASSKSPAPTATSSPAPSGGQSASSNPPCEPGKNGGRTDIGVSVNKIRIATTYVEGGPYGALLKESFHGIRAVINRTNSAGGICGRILDWRITPVGAHADGGYQALKDYIDPKSDIFALAAPSPHALSSAINGKDISQAGIPVVGTDGLHLDQYQEPWVWPVGAATVSQMRIITKYAYNQKQARTFAIVWEKDSTFAKEGREAFVAQVTALGGTIRADVPLGTETTYRFYAEDFNSSEKCGNQACDAVVLLLRPDTAKLWMLSDPKPVMGKLYSAAGQTLSIEGFGQECSSAYGSCPVVIWTGYNPVGQSGAGPGVTQYANDVKAVSAVVDLKNQFTEGAYLGMSLLVEAMKRTGDNLTRAELKKVLDSMDYTTDLSSTLSWRPGKHYANVRARAFGDDPGWVLDPAFVN